ncbi:glycoside hydrolase/phage tail family protein [Ponticoccus sp. SC2-23]|uniref:baseplate multidomain protein megatron n=1 Tax=Alexandriicola marinus TaxID=2081710 RepID=UPI000FDAB494|nr:glycoside hydrolase/phage tail family protein [Alexandriicola marinus]MBM1222560.1 glycoside hydrolase/phage tail family protein [Ponticoccus sp. SC6-9]MBM1227065.1 glycoside hydrolase/phage tail family protein [Ponticoccus sp. SC6-15]MBM1231486.1 glycoside hydrolase/phage tail family protein [Ponticoccus sp. SC6-38]MBM1236078.1 glycoside hydrolase/phage tail family protein [Ponticoccus sp. SC6-45]MBM1240509.1 glycoside hydrolase/phage tail family protein [Ponticoccus sp. SC6-49]MBM1245044
MATIVLSAAGMALGGSIGGSLLGLSGATIGRATGAVIGRVLDQKLLGAGSDAVDMGRVDRFRLTGASEGSPISQLYGRMRLSGQVIWASDFVEIASGSGGKGTASGTGYSYSVSVAIALCRGRITSVGRIWADGQEIATDALNMQLYDGSDLQMPDPKMEAIEGAGNVPAYRGMAYVVFEDLDLGPFGNRMPQFSFEVFRPAERKEPAEAEDIAQLVNGVCLIPGTGEYALASQPVYLSETYGQQVPVNLNAPGGGTDFDTSLTALTEELPACRSVVMVVSWFGDDLRAGSCTIRPKVEQGTVDSDAMPWRVSGLTRAGAQEVPQIDGRPIYGGTTADAAVIEGIRAIRDRGLDVVYYPFILMDQVDGNGLPDPWTGQTGQAPLPWRGRITTSLAPGVTGSPDGTAAAEAEVAAFFGTATAGDFTVEGERVDYVGPEEWSKRRFILHQAHLCAAAGGVEAFCIGSEMRSLTQIRGADNSFPAVAQMIALAAECRAILGPDCRIGYAADWSEYHGYQPDGTGDKLFHLDPLWADPNIDFIGIDNYMPLSDWRDGEDHLDAGAGSIYDLDYLGANVAGGEGYDWFYHSPEARDAQIRTPITDGDGEEWVWRYKDLKGWWSNPHHDRIGGVRASQPTAWVPQSKPIWFTELGCAAIDKGTNQPNKFLDPKSSESALPHYSNGLRDDYIQMQYLRAVHGHFSDVEANPVSEEYGGRMVDMSRAHVWAWDARPFPAFPQNSETWSDGDNYDRGHWLNGRSSSRSLGSVVADICARAGVTRIDVSALHGVVRGYRIDDTDTARSALQVLMLAYGFDAMERDGVLVFRNRDGLEDHEIDPGTMVHAGDGAPTLEISRAPSAETVGTVRLSFVEAEGDYDMRASEAVFPDDAISTTTQTELPLALTSGEGRQIAERWLAEARVARDTASFALPPSALGVGAGDVVRFGGDPDGPLWRVDRVETGTSQTVEAVRVEPESYRPHDAAHEETSLRPFTPPVPVEALFMDLPLLKGDEAPHAPHVAMTSAPWPGGVSLYSAPQDSGYVLNRAIPVPSVAGTTMSVLDPAPGGRWDRGPALRVRLVSGSLRTVSPMEVLAGINAAAIGAGDGENWEVFQFAQATIVEPGVYDLSLRLRGQAGTDGAVVGGWPEGSLFVLLDGTPEQIDLASSARDLGRFYRFGPAQRAIDDSTYKTRELAFRGIGLRPYSVVHPRVRILSGGDQRLSWVRRTRIDGDNWSPPEAPLGEVSERYTIRVSVDGVLRRTADVSEPEWTYSAAMRAADGEGVRVAEVAQLSDSFGPGPYRTFALD